MTRARIQEAWSPLHRFSRIHELQTMNPAYAQIYNWLHGIRLELSKSPSDLMLHFLHVALS